MFSHCFKMWQKLLFRNSNATFSKMHLTELSGNMHALHEIFKAAWQLK